MYFKARRDACFFVIMAAGTNNNFFESTEPYFINNNFNLRKPINIFGTEGTIQYVNFDSKTREVVIGSFSNPSANQDVNIPFYVIGSSNAYFGINVVNYGTFGTSGADVVILNSSASSGASGTYTDIGITGHNNSDANYGIFDADASYAYSQSNNFYLGAGTSGTTTIFAGGFASKAKAAILVDPNQNIAMGTGAVGSAAANGFLYIRGGTGVPTGTPTAKTGLIPLYFDVPGNNLYVYNGAWRKQAGSFV